MLGYQPKAPRGLHAGTIAFKEGGGGGGALLRLTPQPEMGRHLNLRTLRAGARAPVYAVSVALLLLLPAAALSSGGEDAAGVGGRAQTFLKRGGKGSEKGKGDFDNRIADPFFVDP